MMAKPIQHDCELLLDRVLRIVRVVEEYGVEGYFLKDLVKCRWGDSKFLAEVVWSKVL
jgi:hypothetical protein